MPFGPFEDFADCVAKHQEATNPEALCALLHHKITGKWPAEASEHGEGRLNLLDSQISSLLAGFQFQPPPAKTLAGVEVFATGDWRDSKGRALKVTPGDLAKMVKAEGEIPLKVGHTSPEFNRRVAAALGVPVEMLTGEQGGKGQMALGRVARLTIVGNKLLADFEGVPGPLADLIEAGQYSGVSSELDMDAESHPLRLTGVALLGVEQPAIKSLKGLETAAIFGERGNALVFSFDYQKGGGIFQAGKPPKAWWDRCVAKVSQWPGVNDVPAFCGSVWFHDEPISKDSFSSEAAWDRLTGFIMKKEGTLEKFTQNTPVKDIAAAFQEGAGDALTAIAVALGLDPNNATLAAVLKAIEGLKAGGAPMPEGEEMAQQKREFSDMQETIKQQGALLSQYERERRVARFRTLAEGWKTLPGKPSEVAVQLADIEEKAGEATAKLVVAQFQAANLAAEGAGVLVAIGRGKSLTESADPFEKRVQERMAKDGVAYEVALSRETTEDPKAFYAYRSRRNGS